MKPKLKNMVAWQQAELLMQPALIRIVDNIRKQLEDSVWQGTYEEVSEPVPGHQLCLKYQDQEVRIDVWELCYQVCFTNYSPTHAAHETKEVEIDTSLINEAGEVDWSQLDAKTQGIIQQVFANLPHL